MSRQQDLQVDGSAIASQALVDRTLRKAGGTIARLEHVMASRLPGEYDIYSIRLRCDGDPDGEWLAIVNVDVEGRRLVGFHVGVGFVDTLVGVANRIINKSLKLKESEYGN